MLKEKVSSFFSTWPFFIFLLFVLVAYLPALLPFFHVKNDLITQNLPTRFFIGESIYSNTFPWWNPYIDFGLPQYGDMNNGFWNPFIWVIGKCFGYNVLSITLEEMLYILIGGFGVYKLAKYLSMPKWIAVICGLCYMSGGYVIGHLQHLCWITGTAFFPYVLLYYLKCIEDPRLRNFVLGGLSSFLFLAATHPGLIIGALYFFLFLFIQKWLAYKNETGKKGLPLHLIKATALFGLFAICFSIIVWMSDTEVMQQITRGHIVSLGESLQNPTTISSYLSLLFPFSIFKGNFFATDISMRNMSIGVLLCCGIFWYLKTIGINKKNLFYFLSLVFFILLSAGGWFKTFAYYSLPFLGHVRLNGEFAYFVYLPLILLGGLGMDQAFRVANAKVIVHKTFHFLLLFFGAFSIVSLIIGFTTNHAFFLKSLFFESESISLKNSFTSLSFLDLFFISALFQCFFTFFFKKFIHQKKWLISILCFYLILISWITLPFTGISQVPRTTVQEIINKEPRGIVLPRLLPINTNSYINAKYDSIIGSAAFFSKQIGYPVSPPYPVLLKNTSQFYSDSNLVKFIYNQPYLFLASDTSIIAATLYDSSVINVTKYTPTQINATINATSDSYLIFLQNNYPRWKVWVNGKRVNHFSAYKTFIGIKLSRGVNNVVYQFETRSLQVTLFLNIFLLIVAILSLAFSRLRNFYLNGRPE